MDFYTVSYIFNFYTEIAVCSDLALISNGDIAYNAGSPDNRPFSSLATYSCNPGYTLTGGSRTRLCLSGGIWDGSAPVCEGEVCNFYTVCILNKYIVITCSDLTVPANGVISYNLGIDSLRPVGTVAIYTCNTGYTLNGNQTRRACVSGGIWNGSTPNCEG